MRVPGLLVFGTGPFAPEYKNCILLLYQFTMCPAVAVTVIALGFKSPLQYSVILAGLIVGAAGTGFTVTVC